MPPSRPTLSTWMSWPSPTSSNSEVSGANGSARLAALPASASGAIAFVLAFVLAIARFQRAAGKIAVEEAAFAAFGFAHRLLEDLVMQRRQRAGRVGIPGVAGQREGLAAAAAEIGFAEFAGLARLGHPPGAAIAVESFRVLPDPGDRVVRAHRFEFQPGDALGGVARQHLAG